LVCTHEEGKLWKKSGGETASVGTQKLKVLPLAATAQKFFSPFGATSSQWKRNDVCVAGMGCAFVPPSSESTENFGSSGPEESIVIAAFSQGYIEVPTCNRATCVYNRLRQSWTGKASDAAQFLRAKLLGHTMAK